MGPVHAGGPGELSAGRAPARPRGATVPALLAALAATVLALLLGAAALAPSAAAHPRLIGTEPDLGTAVTGPPDELALHFSEPVRPPLTVLVTAGDGSLATADTPYVEGATVEQALRLDAPAGTWNVAYRVVGSDGHPVTGAVTFTVGEPRPEAAGSTGDGVARPPLAVLFAASALALGAMALRRRRVVAGTLAAATGVLVGALVVAGGAPQPVPAGLPDAGLLVGWARPVLRLTVEVALVVAYGVLLGAACLVRGDRGSDAPGRTARVPASDIALAGGASGLAAIAALVQVWVTSADIHGADLRDAADADDVTRFVVTDPQGRSLAAQVLLAGAVAVLALGVAAGRAGVPRRTAAGLSAAAGAALLPPLTVGHLLLGGGGGPGLAQTVLAVHVAAAATWAGGLVALVRYAAVVGPSGMRAALPRFSRIAVACALAVGATGLVNAALRSGDVPDLASSGYGLLVLVKAVAFVVLVVLGAAQRRRVAALTGSVGGSGSAAGAAGRVADVVRVAGAEIVVMAGTFALAAALARTPSPPRAVGADADGAGVLGFAPPQAPTLLRLLTGHVVDGPALLLLALVVAALVAHARALPTPAGRRTAALHGALAVLVLAWATVGGLGLYARLGLAAHVGGHLVVAVCVPVLLLRAGLGARPPWTSVAGRLPAPASAALLVVGTAGVYLPAVLDRVMTADGGHWLQLGLGFVCGAAGLARSVPPARGTVPDRPTMRDGRVVPDPAAVRDAEDAPALPLAGRALVLGAGVLACGLLGWWLVGTTQVVGRTWLESFSVPYLRGLGDGQRRAGFVAWFAGGLPLLAVLGALVLRGGETPRPTASAPATSSDPAAGTARAGM